MYLSPAEELSAFHLIDWSVSVVVVHKRLVSVAAAVLEDADWHFGENDFCVS